MLDPKMLCERTRYYMEALDFPQDAVCDRPDAPEQILQNSIAAEALSDVLSEYAADCHRALIFLM